MSAAKEMRESRPASAEIKRLRAVLDTIDLGAPPARNATLARYLEYARWLDRAAHHARTRHYVLRLTALVGGILLPAIAGIDAAGGKVALQWVTVGLGVVVAVSIAVDGFFNLRERWLHFRCAAQDIQAELWQFAALSGTRYEGMASHDAAFPTLVTTCEAAMAAEVETYVKGPARESATVAPQLASPPPT